jgi:hypothetical protein
MTMVSIPVKEKIERLVDKYIRFLLSMVKSGASAWWGIFMTENTALSAPSIY